MIKRTALDGNFSDALRWSYDWRCQFTEPHPEDPSYFVQCEAHWPECKGFDAQASHFIGRKYNSVRWFPDNVILLCAKHHAIVTDHPALHTAFVRRHLGDVRFEELMLRARRIVRYRPADKLAMSKHFLEEARRIKELRRQGVVGPVELLSWD